MKIRSSIICFLLIFACAGILLGRLDSQGVSDTGRVLATTQDCSMDDGDRGLLESDTYAKKMRATIVIDAGHGGYDPGKVGVNGVNEKDINLEIALLLEQYLTAHNVRVVMTRISDVGLYSEKSTNKKAEDMRNRVALIGESNADLLVSIHQNSYSEAKCVGAQVFYYTGSDPGEKLAKTVQARLVAMADPDNHREAKANNVYYLLKKSPVPAIICECGFLSNPKECEKLSTKQYQTKIAESIFQGIMEYLDVYFNENPRENYGKADYGLSFWG